jgi:predicted permease
MNIKGWLITLPLKLRSVFKRKQVEQELEEELRYHMEMQSEVSISKGIPPEEAQYDALRRMNGIEQRKEECRDERGVDWVEHVIQDLRYGLRVLQKNPGFSAAVIATLALGIGATTAIFSIVYSVVLHPLPYRDSDQLVNLSTVFPNGGSLPGTGTTNYQDWRAQNTVFEEMGLTKNVANFNITGDGDPERVLGGRSTASVFRVLGVEPMVGRLFTEEDGPVEDKVLLSYGLWQRRYAADTAILGKKILLNGSPYLVLGVMPPHFQYPNREFALWTPLAINPEEFRGAIDYSCIARLKRGVSLAQAQEQMAQIQSNISGNHPEISGWKAGVVPMLDQLIGKVRTLLYFLLGAVSCLLLIGCVNLANMFVARSLARSQELVLRTALGAHKRRLVLQSVTEVVPLVALGGTAGVVLAASMLSFLVPLLPSTMPRVEAIRIDLPVLGFALTLLIATALVVGVWPTLRVLQSNIQAGLRDSGRSTTSGAAAVRLRNTLVIAQIATVIVLMVVSALLMRSFGELQAVNPGFRSNDVLALHIAISDAKYPDGQTFAQYCKRLVDSIATVPGVVSVGMVNRLPLAGANQTGGLEFEGSSSSPAESGGFDWRTVTPAYFETLRIPLIEGRLFQESDTADRPPVGIIDERIARNLWPHQSAIGKRFRVTAPGAAWFEIIGVVGHVRHDGLGMDPRGQVYWTYAQRRQPRMAFAVRTKGDPKLFMASVLRAIHDVDSEQPVYDVRPMEEVVERSLSQQWLTTALLTLFASIALMLSSVGVYGVLSYSVGLRSKEIGIRMALGSRRREVIAMILKQGGSLAVMGITIGIVGALFLGGILSAFVYGITPRDGLSFAAASLVLLVVALAASYIPARRAASIDPMSILRSE